MAEMGYCFKCKDKRELVDPTAVWNTNGAPATRGTCAVCGGTIYKTGHTPAHDKLPKPKGDTAKATTKEKAKAKNGGKATAKAPTKAAKGSKTEETKAKTTPKSAEKAVKQPATKSTTKQATAAAGAATTAVRRLGKLIIVESPAKAKTIGKYLGKGYTVKSSVGHVRDLLKSRLSVDVDNHYAPEYRVPNEKRALIKELKEAAAKAQEIFLATDPDREGEAIAWHVLESAEMDPARTKRIVFHEITKTAVENALLAPREIDMQRVNAQQARRILDRLVGYQLSPLLWRKVRGRLSAGRVQSVAVRLVVERERDIEKFVSEEYWSVHAELKQQLPKARLFMAKWHKYQNEDITLKSEADVSPHIAILEKSAWGVGKVKLGTRQRRPAPPFITSTLQQEASRKLGFGTSKTMRIAQQLYEGVEIPEGSVGLITYMRTDSFNVSQESQQLARQYIEHRYGKEFVPEKPPYYKTKSKSAQEAHEAIRPTSVMRTPNLLKDHLSRDQFRLYELIWSRFVACQMEAAVYNTVTVDIYAGSADVALLKRPYWFRAMGSTLKFAGFLALYEETDPNDKPEEGENFVPDTLSAEELLNLVRLLPEQHFTQPPPRFSEATLVKALEEYGIGRPSTYASIITTIIDRGYVERDNKRLIPTEIGRTVNDMLVEYFPGVLSVDFTAQLEDQLDEIAEGKDWVPVVDNFYQPFRERLAIADEELPKVILATEPDYVGRDCPLCQMPLVYRQGKFGRFIGCKDFPRCRHTEQLLIKTGVSCALGGGEIVEKKTKKGRIFYGCTHYPTCNWTSWTKPVSADANGIFVEAGKESPKSIPCGESTTGKTEDSAKSPKKAVAKA